METFHRDDFVLRSLPPRPLWPTLQWFGTGEPAYPPRLNAATELLSRAVDEGHESRTAILFEDEQWTYARVCEEANRIANVLTNQWQVTPGQRVLLHGPNTPRLIAAWFAVLKAGAVAVVTVPALRARELSSIIDRARVNIVLCDDRLSGETLHAALVRSAWRPTEAAVFNETTGSAGSLDQRMRAEPPVFTDAATVASDPAIIAFTSGTTGHAKGTVHTHRDLLTVCDTFSKHVIRPRSDDVFTGTASLGFTYGLGGLLLFPFRARASTALQPRTDAIFRTISERRCTILFGSPALYRLGADLASRFQLSSLKTCVSAGETLPGITYQRWLQNVGLRIVDGLGSTELLHVFISAPPAETRPGATGRLVPGYEAKIIDEEGKRVPDGVIGRLAVRGPTGCRYLDDPKSQRDYVASGWNLTGDAYMRHPDGYFSFHARVDDLIVTEGMNVSGAEVESVLLEHPAVREAAVVARRDDRSGGTYVKAFVVCRETTQPSVMLRQAIQHFVRSQIAEFKCPRWIDIVSELPRTATGKVQRFTLRSGDVATGVDVL